MGWRFDDGDGLGWRDGQREDRLGGGLCRGMGSPSGDLGGLIEEGDVAGAGSGSRCTHQDVVAAEHQGREVHEVPDVHGDGVGPHLHVGDVGDVFGGTAGPNWSRFDRGH